MVKHIEIDFYKERDEEAFLKAYEEVYGELTEDDFYTLYASIALDIHDKVNKGTHELGKEYIYRDVLVGKSDFNESHGLYLFTRNE